MTEKKSFFGFLKKWTTSPTTPTTYASEEAAQTQHAKTATKTEYTPKQTDHYKPSTPQVAKETIPVAQSVLEFAISKLEEILKLSLFGGKVIYQRQEEDRLFFEILESEDVGRIIGKDGMTLDALQTLLRAFIFKKFGTMLKIYLDIEEYRNKREEMLKNHALKSAKAVLTKTRKADLKPMNPDERRLIHGLFQDDKRIRSYSVGTGVYRHIVLERRSRAAQEESSFTPSYDTE